MGSLSSTSSPSILAEAPAHRVAAASSNQVSRPLWMVERIKPCPIPTPANIPDSENLTSIQQVFWRPASGRTLAERSCHKVPGQRGCTRGNHHEQDRAAASGQSHLLLTRSFQHSPAPPRPASKTLRRGPALVPGTDLTGGGRHHQGGQTRLPSSSAVMADHGEQRPHMTRQHAPPDRLAQLAVGDDLTVLCDIEKDGACCDGGLSQPRGEPVEPLPYRETVTDSDGKRL